LANGPCAHDHHRIAQLDRRAADAIEAAGQWLAERRRLVADSIRDALQGLRYSLAQGLEASLDGGEPVETEVEQAALAVAAHPAHALDERRHPIAGTKIGDGLAHRDHFSDPLMSHRARVGGAGARAGVKPHVAGTHAAGAYGDQYLVWPYLRCRARLDGKGPGSGEQRALHFHVPLSS